MGVMVVGHGAILASYRCKLASPPPALQWPNPVGVATIPGRARHDAFAPKAALAESGPF
jgi:hypothetical protein